MKKLLFSFMAASIILIGCTVQPPGTTAPTKQEVSQDNKITGVISQLADGDTYNVVMVDNYEVRKGVYLSKGEEITIRLLLVDTPESVGEKAGMPYGNESSSYAKGLLKDKTVTLEFDEGDIKDKYDRYLAYVYVDGKRVQDYLLENGYAMIRYVNEPNTRYLAELEEIEKRAREQALGIWSIEGYVSQNEGYNEVGLKPDIKAIGEDVKEKALKTAEDLFGETLDSALDTFSSP